MLVRPVGSTCWFCIAAPSKVKSCDIEYQFSLKMIGRTARNSIRLSCGIRPAAYYSTNSAVQPPPKVYSNAELNKMTLDEWAEAFKKETVEVAKMDITTISYDESAARMRRLLKTRILAHDDIVRRPERFFLVRGTMHHHTSPYITMTVHHHTSRKGTSIACPSLLLAGTRLLDSVHSSLQPMRRYDCSAR